jgi:hypothetical protein
VPAALAGPIMPARAIRRIRGSERLRSNALSAIVVNASRRARRQLTALPLICYRELVEPGCCQPSSRAQSVWLPNRDPEQADSACQRKRNLEPSHATSD